MPKQRKGVIPESLMVDPRATETLTRQIHNGLRDLILSGALPAGTRLASTRTLSDALGVSRSTVVSAIERLVEEGYLQSRVGDGTHVPDTFEAVPTTPASLVLPSSTTDLLRQAEAWSPQAFAPLALAVPSLDRFPWRVWRQLSSRTLRDGGAELLGPGDPAGEISLRTTLTQRLGAQRGVRAEPEQVMIFSSVQEVLHVVCRVFLRPGDVVWMENPGYPAARGVFLSCGARIVDVPVDDDGLDVRAGRALQDPPRVIFVTPSHQFPLGVRMSLPRRLELLSFARERGCLVIEDDYDGEFRFEGEPVPSLQGLDASGSVLFTSSFSKSLFPSLRMAFAVVPPSLVDAIRLHTVLLRGTSPRIPQRVVAEFIQGGHLAAHTRRMARLYARRGETLRERLKAGLGSDAALAGVDQGLHIVVRLSSGIDDIALEDRLREQHVESRALSRYYFGHPPQRGLVLGFAAYTVEQIEAASTVISRTVSGLLSERRNPPSEATI